MLFLLFQLGKDRYALEASRADTSVRQALQQLAKDDPNPYIRTESRKMLASMPEID